MPRALGIIFLGPPGSGKGTQANEIVRRREGLYHFNLGRFIESVIYAEKNKGDPVIQSERERFEKGLLCTTSWVMEIVKEEVERVAQSGRGVVLSGSPRTREEAEFLAPFLLQIYGEGNIVVFHLLLSDETSIFRNVHRRVCDSCGAPVLWSEANEKLGYCTRCGGKLVTRTLDNLEAMKLRLREYSHKAEAILALFTAIGIPVFDIEGNRSPDKIADQVEIILNEKFP